LQHVQSSHHHSRSARLHPRVYGVIIALAAWLALSAWGFSGSEDTGADLTVVTGLVLMSIGLPTILWLIGRKYRQPRDGKVRQSSLHDWLFGDFEVWQTHLRGLDAAIAILLPIAAVSIGMTFFAIVRHLAVAD
jgi:hypothetical protein